MVGNDIAVISGPFSGCVCMREREYHGVVYSTNHTIVLLKTTAFPDSKSHKFIPKTSDVFIKQETN